mgnify:CR=1 FL=1
MKIEVDMPEASQSKTSSPAKAGAQVRKGALQLLGPRFRGERNGGDQIAAATLHHRHNLYQDL